MITTLKKYRFIVVPLVLCAVLVGVFWRPLIDIIESGLSPTKQAPVPTVTTPAYRPLIVGQLCLDTPPWYSATYARQAENAVANKIDSMAARGNQAGVHLFVSFIDSSSFEDNALTITVPAVSAEPIPPMKPSSSDPYKQSSLMHEYNKLLASWQSNDAAWQKNLTLVRSQVRQQTDKLRSLPVRYDNKGSSIWGCLETASLNFQGMKAQTVLWIASTMLDNVPQPLPTTFSLAAVSIQAIYHVCITSAAVCAANDTYWKHTMMHYGAKKVQFFTVQQSEVSSLDF